MATLSDSLVSSSARKLAMRMRPDLSARQHRYQGRVYWVVKEPVGLNYFRFQEEEYAILQMLDGRISLDEIKDQFEAQFPPQKITVEELQQFIGMLHKSGLIIANVPGQGRQLRKRRDERKRKERLAAMTNILAVRFKGIDPERLLNWLYPFVRPVFTPLGVFIWAVTALSALALVTVQFDVFQAKLPGFHQFFTLENAKYLAVVLAVTKVLHEFGHGLSCKHFGGECHEMGIMFLVLTPCLYCNVSDSWMLPNKWRRAVIGFAGMYVEIFIASICTFVWWFSEPGMLNYLCLSTIFVCSVSTLLFNGNPLLRYDGYYILADIVEIPNLRQKSTTILNRKLGWWCLGLEPPEDPFLPQRNQMFFALYTVAAAAYRWFVVLSILFFLYKVFEPYGLKIIGQMIGMMSIYGLVVQPLWKVGKFFYVPGRIDKVKKPRMYATLGLLTLVIAAFVFVPLPHRVYCTLEVKPRDAVAMYITVPGVLEEVNVQPGQAVTAAVYNEDLQAPAESSAVLARLSNIDITLAVARLEAQSSDYEIQLASLRNERGYGDDEAGARIPEVQKSLEAVREQLRQKRTDLKHLELVAPSTGVVLPPQEMPDRPDPDGRLSTWSGSPLQEKNLGTYLEEGVLFCYVGDPTKKKAVLVIDQSDIPFVTEGDQVDIKLDQMAGETIVSVVEDISPGALEVSPRQLSNKAGGELSTKTDESGVERPMSTSYQATVNLEDPDQMMRIGLRGRARIHVGWQPLAGRLWRFVSETFHFQL